MNKLIVTILAMLAIGIAIYTFSSKSTTPEATNVANEPQIPTYIDVEIKLDVAGRDVSGKLVFEFPNIKRCEEESNNKQSFIQEYNQQCTEMNGCKSIQIGSCSNYVDHKYISMLNKQFKGSHYMHLSDPTYKNERGVIAFWGLSDAEAEKICQGTLERSKDKSIVAECL